MRLLLKLEEQTREIFLNINDEIWIIFLLTEKIKQFETLSAIILTYVVFKESIYLNEFAKSANHKKEVISL